MGTHRAADKLHVLSPLNSWEGGSIIPILQMRKLSLNDWVRLEQYSPDN